MEKKQLVKPQNAETVENVAVYACETNMYCQTNDGSCGSGCPCPNTYICGVTCADEINVTYCGSGCGS